PTDINKLARLYNSSTLRIVTTPAIICKNKYIKLSGTINPNSNKVRTCAKKPKRASKKDLKINGNMHKGTTYTYEASIFTTTVVKNTIKIILKNIKVTSVLLL